MPSDDNRICMGVEPPSVLNIFAHENEINILKDTYQNNQVDVTRDCKSIVDHVVRTMPPLPPPAVYTLPELDEELEEDNTVM